MTLLGGERNISACVCGGWRAPCTPPLPLRRAFACGGQSPPHPPCFLPAHPPFWSLPVAPAYRKTRLCGKQPPTRPFWPKPLAKSEAKDASPSLVRGHCRRSSENLLPRQTVLPRKGTPGGGDPGRTRTCNLRIRSPLLYPVELRGLECRRPVRRQVSPSVGFPRQ